MEYVTTYTDRKSHMVRDDYGERHMGPVPRDGWERLTVTQENLSAFMHAGANQIWGYPRRGEFLLAPDWEESEFPGVASILSCQDLPVKIRKLLRIAYDWDR